MNTMNVTSLREFREKMPLVPVKGEIIVAQDGEPLARMTPIAFRLSRQEAP